MITYKLEPASFCNCQSTYVYVAHLLFLLNSVYIVINILCIRKRTIMKAQYVTMLFGIFKRSYSIV